MHPMDVLINVLLSLGILSINIVIVMIPLRLVVYVVIWLAMWVVGKADQFEHKIWW